MVMDRERFKALAEAYGGDMARWPAEARDAAAARLATEPDFAARVLARASALDQALEDWTTTAVSHDLRDRIIAQAPRSRPARAPAWLGRLGVGAGLAAACAAGLVLGVQMAGGGATSPEDRDVVQAMTSLDLGLSEAGGDV